MKASVLVILSTLVILGYLSAARGSSAIWPPTTSIALAASTFTDDNYYSFTFGPNPEIATYADVNLGNGSALVNVPIGVVFTKAPPGGTSTFYIYRYSVNGVTFNNPSVNFPSYDSTKDLNILIWRDSTNIYTNVSQPGGNWATSQVTIQLGTYSLTINTIRLVGHDPTWIWPIKNVNPTWGLQPPNGVTYIPILSWTAGSSLQVTFAPNPGYQPNAEISLGNSNTNVNVPIGVKFTKGSTPSASSYYAYSYWSNGVATVSPSYPYTYNPSQSLVISMSRDAHYIYCNITQWGGTLLNIWFPPNLINNSVVPTINMLKITGYTGPAAWPVYSVTVL
jgi:hypothetical protein